MSEEKSVEISESDEEEEKSIVTIKQEFEKSNYKELYKKLYEELLHIKSDLEDLKARQNSLLLLL
jgi:hypothetical protein